MSRLPLFGFLFLAICWGRELEYRHSVHLTGNKADDPELSLKNLDRVASSILQNSGRRNPRPTTLGNPYSRKLRCSNEALYRTIDGTCNNLEMPWLGAAKTPLQRLAPNRYEDGVGLPRTNYYHSSSRFPTSREVSLAIMLDRTNISNKFSHLLMNFGQFLDHDLTLSPEAGGEGGQEAEKKQCCKTAPKDYAKENLKDCFPIFTPRDPIFKRTCIPFLRSASVPGYPGSSIIRHQLNDLTAYVDGSQIYGSTKLKATELRSHVGGELRSTRIHGEEGLPSNKDNPSNCQAEEADCQFAAGDIRSSEQAGLTSIHTLFLREHNRIAQQLAQLNPQWKDEELYQVSRKILGAILQKIVYGEFLPLVLGPKLMQNYKLNLLNNGRFHGYSPKYDPSITTEFSTAAFRFGHSLVRQTFSRSKTQEVDLQEMFKAFKVTGEFGPDAFMKGLMMDHAESCERFVTKGLRNELFDDEADLPAFNIQRGRDHGIPSYNDIRRYFGLPIYKSFMEMSGSSHAFATTNDMQKVYHSIEDVEIFPGGLSEVTVNNGIVGETFGHIIGSQFKNLKYGDRFWHEIPDDILGFTDEQLQEIREVSLATIYCENVPGVKVREQVMLIESFSNPMINCNKIYKMDLSLWKVGAGRKGKFFDDKKFKKKLDDIASKRRKDINTGVSRRVERQRKRQQALKRQNARGRKRNPRNRRNKGNRRNRQ